MLDVFWKSLTCLDASLKVTERGAAATARRTRPRTPAKSFATVGGRIPYSSALSALLIHLNVSGVRGIGNALNSGARALRFGANFAQEQFDDFAAADAFRLRLEVRQD